MQHDHCCCLPQSHSLIVDCSDILILLCFQSAAYHAYSFPLPPSVLSLLTSCCDPLMFMSKICLFLLYWLLPNCPTSFASSCAFGWLPYQFFSICVASFLSFSLLACSLFFSSLRLIHLLLYTYKVLPLGSVGFAPWLSGWAGGLSVQSFLILSNFQQFSACLAAALKIGCQSSVKESVSKKVVQRILVAGLCPWSCIARGPGVKPTSADTVLLRKTHLITDRVQVCSGGRRGEYEVVSTSHMGIMDLVRPWQPLS